MVVPSSACRLIIIITIMTLKAQLEISFCNFFTVSRTVSNTYAQVAKVLSYVQITCNTSGAHHMQHAVCHEVQRDSSAIKTDIIEIAFIFDLFNWLQPKTDEAICFIFA